MMVFFFEEFPILVINIWKSLRVKKRGGSNNTYLVSPFNVVVGRMEMLMRAEGKFHRGRMWNFKIE